MTCTLYKIQLSVTDPHGDIEVERQTFWGYNFNEAKARDAAIRWGSEQHPNSFVSITKVDVIK